MKPPGVEEILESYKIYQLARLLTRKFPSVSLLREINEKTVTSLVGKQYDTALIVALAIKLKKIPKKPFNLWNSSVLIASPGSF